MKIWILGAAGQLGRALIDQCTVSHIPFVASDRKEVDISNLSAVEQIADQIDCTHIVNCAGYTDVDRAEKEISFAFSVNAQGAENVGIVARNRELRLVHVSTDYVFEGSSSVPYKEEVKPQPLGVYGKSKWEGEVRLLDQLPNACIVRTSWIFGHGGKNFISSVFELLQTKGQVEAICDQMSRATYNRDLAQVLIDLACHSGIFHFANRQPLSRYQIAQDFFEAIQSRGIPLKCKKILPVSADRFPTKALRPNYSVLDTEKVSLLLGRKPRLWKTILNEYLDSYVQKQI